MSYVWTHYLYLGPLLNLLEKDHKKREGNRIRYKTTSQLRANRSQTEAAMATAMSIAYHKPPSSSSSSSSPWSSSLIPAPRGGSSSASSAASPTRREERRNLPTAAAALVAGGTAALAMAASAQALPVDAPVLALAALQEPENALSLPTWAIHVSSVIEWVIAMVLVWQYGEKSGFQTWKGLTWGMVPLLGGALCACTWHFFYNAESLEILVALQAALTVLGNMTMCFAAFRIYKASQEGSKSS
ncbi:uncharacterized protein LOC135598657 [Musa acuminata AAA Group]